ncbi:MAG: hypothetical protein AAGA61_04930, partial [Pseudomonadota bacterium]
MTYRHLLTASALLIIAACGETESPEDMAAEAPAAAGPTNAEEALRYITADLMREYVIEISDDKYEGRGPGSRGDAAARNYLAERMAEMGLQPGAADGSWEQPFD